MGQSSSKQEEQSQSHAFLACFVWVNTWLFFPFIATGGIWYRWGLLAAASFWLILGSLVPSLSQNDGMRRLISSMRFWIDGKEIIGSLEGASSGKPLLHCHHPHGAVGINGCSKGGLDLAVRAVVAPACFRMPLCRQLMELMGAVSSAKDHMTRHMRQGRSFAMLPGGVEEVVLNDQGVERAYIMKRKGFVKYALQYGFDIVPIYHFGETELYDVLWVFRMPCVLRWRLHIAEKFQLALGMGIGWPWMPNLPKRGKKCVTVIGKQITLPHIKTPLPQDVEKYHNIYVEQLVDLYNENRHLLPSYASKELELW